MSTSKKQQQKVSASVKLVNLSPEEVQRLPRPREGFAQYADSLLSLYEANAGALGSGFDPAAAREALASYMALDASLAAARKQLEMVEETRLLHASTVWTAMLSVYARARAASRNDVTLRRALADFMQFMKKHPPKPPKATTAPTTPPNTPSV